TYTGVQMFALPIAHLRLVTCATSEDLKAPELGDILRHRVVKLHAPFFVQCHEPDADDGLGHGVDAEDRVALDRRARLQVAPAIGLEMHYFAAALDHRDGAGELASIDVRLDMACEAGHAR